MSIPLILGSASPRRKELMNLIGYPFQVYGSDLEEETISIPLPEGVEQLARQKAEKVAANFKKGLVLGADTVVEIEGDLLGKPEEIEEAREMIKKISGKVHQVYTGVALIDVEQPEKVSTDFGFTRVHFSEVGEKELFYYLSSEDWKGKAGGYAIQGLAGMFVEKIEGCYFNVVGLPLRQTYLLLAKEGLDVPKYWRETVNNGKPQIIYKRSSP